MKKIVLILGLTVISQFIFSQNIYFALQGGYNYGLAKEKVQIYSPPYVADDNDIEPTVFANITENKITGDETIEAIPVSFAQGFSYGANIGFMYKKIGFEVNAFYQKGIKYTAHYYDNASINLQSTNLNIIPAFVYKSDTGKFAVVSKLGLIMASSEIETNINTSDNYYTEKSLQTGKLYFGAYLSVGAEYAVIKNLYISVSIDASLLQYNPEKVVLKEYIIDGEDNINEDYITKEIIFVDSKNIDNTDDDNKRLKPYYNMSSIGFKLGIKYNFAL